MQFLACVLALQGANEQDETRWFVAEKKSLVYARYKTSYSLHTYRASLFHLKIMHGKHFWRGGTMSGGKVFAPNYCTDPPYAYSFQSNTNVLTGISKLSFAETFFHMAS